MKLLFLFFLSFFFLANNEIDKTSFYNALESESLSEIESKITNLNAFKDSELKNAYIGALKMKQAQYLKTVKDKVAKFKEGKDLLEESIKSSAENGEYRFLRLVIQENAPKVLKYNTNITEDVEVIQNKYAKLDSVLRQIVKKYAAKSKHLSSTNLK